MRDHDAVSDEREPLKILVLSASLRDGSLNTRLARLAADAVGRHGAVADLASMRDFDAPSYDGDLEASDGMPPGAQAFRERLEAADGFVIASPEYNASMPGVLKNAIDWVSRPTDGENLVALSGFRGKVAGLMAASISPFGGLRGISHLRQILSTIQVTVATEQVLVPFAQSAFDEDRRLKEALPAQLLGGLAARVIDLAERLEPPIS